MLRIFILVICLFIAGPIWSADLGIEIPHKDVMFTQAGGTTNYANDASCSGAWRMNLDTTASETDRSSNGYDLAVSASDSIPRSATVPGGYSGYSRDFENTDTECLSIADGSATNLDINGADAKLSIVGWIRIEPTFSSGYRAFVAKWDAADAGKQYLLRAAYTASDQFSIQFFVRDGTNTVSVTSSTTNYAVSTWYHIAAVANDTDLRIYVNGSLNCTPVAHTAGIQDTASTFFVGDKYPASGEAFDGLLDEIGVFRRELSSTEVSDIYTNGLFGDKGSGDS